MQTNGFLYLYLCIQIPLCDHGKDKWELCIGYCKQKVDDVLPHKLLKECRTVCAVCTNSVCIEYLHDKLHMPKCASHIPHNVINLTFSFQRNKWTRSVISLSLVEESEVFLYKCRLNFNMQNSKIIGCQWKLFIF